MSFSSWLSSVSQPRRRTIRKAIRRSTQLSVQQLEVRLTPSTLATHALLEGPAVGSASAVVTTPGAWTAAANDAWLHTTSSGTGNGTAAFTLDANTGATRAGTLTVAGETLTVTQAGSTYEAAHKLFLVGSGGTGGNDVAVDGAGNVYSADYYSNAIKKWDASTQTVSTLASGVDRPRGVAVDGAGNVFFIDGNSTIMQWNATTQQVSTVIAASGNQRTGLAVDGAGNLYIAGHNNYAAPARVEKWDAATHTLSTVFSLPSPRIVGGNGGIAVTGGVALDAAGNLYLASFDTIFKWNAATQSVSSFIEGLNWNYGVAVDGSGDVYFDNAEPSAINPVIQKWHAATQTISTVVTRNSGGLAFNSPDGMAVDSAGNVYISDTNGTGITRFPHAFVPTTPINEFAAAGSSSLGLPVLSTTQPLTGIFAPTSDQSWLTIDSVPGDVVHFSFTENTTGASRTANISILGTTTSVTQSAVNPNAPPVIAVNAPASLTVNEGSLATKTGTWSDADAGDTVTLSASIGTVVKSGTNAAGTWSWSYTPAEEAAAQTVTITANDGTVSTQTTFSLTVTDAPLTAGVLTPPTGTGAPTVSFFANSGFAPEGVAVDASGNVYYTNYTSSTISKATPAGAVSTFFSLPPGTNPDGLAFDAAGNLYVSIVQTGTITKITFSAPGVFGGSSTFVTTPAFSQPQGMAFDSAGNLYVGRVQQGVAGAGSIAKYNSSGAVINVNFATGFSVPRGLAFDQTNNILYVTSTSGTTISKVTETGTAATTGTVSLFAAGLSNPYGLTFGPGGNLYVANAGDNTIRKMTFSSPGVLGTQSTFVVVTLAPDIPTGLAFGNSGNLYVGNIGDFGTDTGTISKITPPLLVEGQAFTNQVVFHFTDADPAGAASDYSALVTRGDGTSVTLTSAASANGQIVANAGSGFDVQLSYTYPEEFTNHTFSVTVTDVGGASTSASTSTFSVADAPLTAGTVSASGGVAGLTPTSLAATFTDANTGAPTSDFSGSIYWGDTTSSNFTSSAVTGSNGSYSVSGSHQYATAGNFNISVTINDDGGQSTSDTGSTTVASAASFTTTVGASPFTYDGTTHAGGSGTVTGAGGLSTSATSLTYSANSDGTGTADRIDAGTYYVTAHYAGDASHLPSDGAAVALVINKADATVVVTPYSVTYDGSPHSATITSITGVNSETGATVGSVTLSTTHTDAGTYASDAWSFTGTANYNNIASTTITDTIGQKAATVTADHKTKTYGDANPTLTATVTGTVNSDSLSYTLATTAGQYSNVGDVPIKVSLGTNGNYSVTPANDTLTIGQKIATVTADHKTKTYGDANPALTATVTGTVNGDVLSYSLATTAGQYSNVGDYGIAVTLGTNGNYAVTATNDTLTIGKKAATVAANAKSKNYGNVNPALTATVSGTVNGDVLNYTLATTAGQSSNVGGYPIAVTLGTNGNYSVTSTDSTLTINQATLVTTGRSVTPIAGAPFVNGVVASFAAAGPTDTAASYTATITWGDGSSSAGTIALNTATGLLQVTGSHTYADPRIDTTSVLIANVLGNTSPATVGGTATVTSLGVDLDDNQARQIGFWHSNPGHALIASLNGGATATALSNWLATNFPNLYGATAGSHNLTGQTNSQVVAFFESLYAMHRDNPDVEVLATALNVYVTTTSLGGTAGEAYNFRVTPEGLGAVLFNVGEAGATVGAANGTTMNAFQMLQAANQRAVGGVLYAATTSLRDPAEGLFEKITRTQYAQTEEIGFWHRDGQALINSFNGGSTATALGNWLAVTFPNLYGATAGSHNLTGQTNAQVAAFFQTLWGQGNDNADVQVLATALNVYATTLSLGGTVGQAYGFLVTNEGLGAVSFTVNQGGAAVGVANGTTLNVYELLQAVNQRAVNGVLAAGNASQQDQLEDLFERLNRAGDGE